ncbi:anti-sigma factor [Cohnella ginsengisoli]|uniref:Anti-sigma-W factor RsiW n=1 Tax=Cohnella ginsengisoli TaxID=425004 RepID=A0A9X4KRR0_9BACL|nr:anti-sigma factor [Cohnella ginsengisoli]MDG0794957.1 anti-sigma factor [Cohnella ginsengisoli]
MTQPHDETCDLLELYMLGGLDEAEALRFEAHLSSCESCQEQRLALADIVGLLPATAEPQPVPEGMKKRILANVLAEAVPAGSEAKTPPTASPSESQPSIQPSIQPAPKPATPASGASILQTTTRRTPAYMKLVTAGLAAALIALALYAAQLRGQVGDLRGELAEAGSAPVQELKVNQAVKLNPAAADIVATGLATIVIDKNGTHLLVQAEQLPKLQGNEAYQVWLIKGQEKFSAGTFLSDQGTGAIYYTLKNGGYDTVAITLEPDAFGDQPRGKIVLAAALDA